jgi:hypothetical protein
MLDYFVCNSGNQNWTEIRSRCGATDFLSFAPVSLVRVPPTHWHSQYPCPKFDIAALFYDIYNAYILKQRLIGVSSVFNVFPAKVGAKFAKGPTEPPRMI